GVRRAAVPGRDRGDVALAGERELAARLVVAVHARYFRCADGLADPRPGRPAVRRAQLVEDGRGLCGAAADPGTAAEARRYLVVVWGCREQADLRGRREAGQGHRADLRPMRAVSRVVARDHVA